MTKAILIALLLLLPSLAQGEENTEDTVPVPSNGLAGGSNASVWKAQCAKGMVMTGIEIVVGGTCNNQCNADGRPMAGYRILCSRLK